MLLRHQKCLTIFQVSMKTSIKTKKELALQLACDILEQAKENDKAYKVHCIAEHKAQQASGDDFMVYFLNELVVLLEDINNGHE